MTTEQFWDKYINQDILDIFEDTCDFFSKELPKEFLDNYDVGEVILETRGHQETAKNYDNVIQFTEIIQNKQPELYKEYFQYFNDFLIDYHLFMGNTSEARTAFFLFIDNPLHSYDQFLQAFKKILFYQQVDLIEQAASRNYSDVQNSDDLVGDAARVLAISMFYVELQKIYEKGDKTIGRKAFKAKMSDYDFKFATEFLSWIETGLFNPLPDAAQLNVFFKKEKQSAITILQGAFHRYMHERGFAFCLSGKIWDELLDYWHENNLSATTIEGFFRVKTQSFDKFLTGFISNLFIDNKSEMITVLWGSVYFFEFLQKYSIISEKQFAESLETTKELKGVVIGRLTPYLWASEFVHSWEKPHCISETEFSEEKKIFRKSISFKNQDFSELKNHISEELSKIGEMEHYIIKGSKSTQNAKNTNLLDNFFNESEEYKMLDPVRTEAKIGRNDPCSCGSGKKFKKCCGI